MAGWGREGRGGEFLGIPGRRREVRLQFGVYARNLNVLFFRAPAGGAWTDGGLEYNLNQNSPEYPGNKLERTPVELLDRPVLGYSEAAGGGVGGHVRTLSSLHSSPCLLHSAMPPASPCPLPPAPRYPALPLRGRCSAAQRRGRHEGWRHGALQPRLLPSCILPSGRFMPHVSCLMHPAIQPSSPLLSGLWPLARCLLLAVCCLHACMLV